VLDPTAPTEEVSGGLRWRFHENWSTSYRAFYDIDNTEFRRQDIGLIFDDDCTRIEVVYTRDNIDNGVIGNNDGVAIRIALATLGSLD
jgi:LPS-assembly protein